MRAKVAAKAREQAPGVGTALVIGGANAGPGSEDFEEALAAVERALEGARTGMGAELVSEDLRLAARALGRITGSIDVEDLLDRIFSQFCVGK